MDFTEIQRKLSFHESSSAESEFSFSQVLSLPLDFLAFIVKNRREADLLLKVSESSARLDLLTQNYEMFASRAQALQEAWNGLWLAQEPYLVPAIPLIGLEMSGVNDGQSILLEKLGCEFKTLKELGKELCHYIDVNHSLVEELRMEGIERLAVNKLLLVEVEKELVRRITHLCSNKSIRDLSPIKQFLCQLKKPTLSSMKIGMGESKDCGNSTMNGSCSTEKITTDGSSEAQERSPDIVSGHRDVISPDSQSFASKCVSTQGDTMHPPFISTPKSELPAKKLDFEQSRPGAIVTSSKASLLEAKAGVGGIKLDVRNHSSSASEERLPKASCSGHPLTPMNITDIKEDLYKRADKQSADLLVHNSKELDLYGNETLLHRVFTTDRPRSSKEGSSKLESTEELANVDSRISGDLDILAFGLLEDKACGASSETRLKSFDLDQMNKTSSHALPTTQPDMKGSKRMRPTDCEASFGGIAEESIDVVARNCKRIMVQVSQGVREAVHASTGTFATKRMFLHSIEEGLSHSSFTVGLDNKHGGRVNTPTGLCLPCSCNLPIKEDDAVDAIPTMQGRCKECGCLLAHSNQTACEEDAHFEQGRVSESPIPFTQ
ncbi:hypothetical protein GOP47_0004756 [Adiantum capillus-veneris]|uniref:Uncharacterized protein n=1 Tax=Adiantum capillus-veneris TaxID=13818 RepID=A0A9D4V4K8_ADICA|nr:hypothetical protein GOP47_0004756 [Adiantum capillus-veneris]